MIQAVTTHGDLTAVLTETPAPEPESPPPTWHQAYRHELLQED